jgi:predicted nucleotidyltransferase
LPELDTQLSQVLLLLLEADVRFVVIGGAAMVLHGSDHITQDIDFSYDRKRGNLRTLSRILSSRKAKLRGVPDDVPFILDEYTFRNVQNMTLDTDLGAVDLLAVPEGVDSFEGLWERARVMNFGGYTVRVASIDDLIAMKRAANRPKDQNHILELLALKKLLAEESGA